MKIILSVLLLLSLVRTSHAQTSAFTGYWTNGIGFTVINHPINPNDIITTNAWYTLVSTGNKVGATLIFTNGQVMQGSYNDGDDTLYTVLPSTSGWEQYWWVVTPQCGNNVFFYSPQNDGPTTNYNDVTYTLNSYFDDGIYTYLENGEAFVGSDTAPSLGGMSIEILTTEGSYAQAVYTATDHCLLTFGTNTTSLGTTTVNNIAMPLTSGTYTGAAYTNDINSIYSFESGTWVAEQLNRTTYRIFFTEMLGTQIIENYTMILTFCPGYRCWVENYGQIYQTYEHGSASITQIIPTTKVTATKPAFTLNLTNQTVTVSNNFAMSVAATGTATIQYQWYQNGFTLLNATNPIYTVTNASVYSAGQYYVMATNAGGIERSAVATVTVYVPPIVIVSPTFVVNPTNTTVPYASNIVLSALATGNPSVSYQWYDNASLLLNATNNSLLLTNATSQTAGVYYVQASNAGGTTNSAHAVLTVLGTAPKIISGPTNMVVEAHTIVILTVVATGPELHYQWYQGSTELPANTNDWLVLTMNGGTGIYSVRTSNPWGTNTIVATISVRVPAATLKLAAIGTNGMLTITGTSGDIWNIQSSTNLVTWVTNWTSVTIGTTNAAAVSFFKNKGWMFFRASQ